jgi:hypothetical protein
VLQHGGFHPIWQPLTSRCFLSDCWTFTGVVKPRPDPTPDLIQALLGFRGDRKDDKQTEMCIVKSEGRISAPGQASSGAEGDEGAWQGTEGCVEGAGEAGFNAREKSQERLQNGDRKRKSVRKGGRKREGKLTWSRPGRERATTQS